jgi:hypothetical protein
VQPELKAVLQPHGADRVSACGWRAAALSLARLVAWCSARAQAAACCGREGLGASAGAQLSGYTGNAGGLRVRLDRVGRAAVGLGRSRRVREGRSGAGAAPVECSS